MTVYAPSDHVSITVPDGCGEPHLLTDERALTCSVCEPLVLAMKTGWANTPEAVDRTPDERAADELAQKGAARERDRTFGDPHALAAVIRDAITPAERPLSLVEQIAALGPADRAALKALLFEADNAATTAEAAVQSKAPRLTGAAPAGDESVAPQPSLEGEVTPVTAVTTQPVVPVKIVKPATASAVPPATKPAATKPAAVPVASPKE